MGFKFFRGNVGNINFIGLEPLQLLTLQPQRFNNVEYCFQFDDEEPQVFGGGSERLTINIEPQSNSDVSFNHDGRRFKIFARNV